jgi:hypothetical protein
MAEGDDVGSTLVKVANSLIAFLSALAGGWFLITIVWSGFQIIRGAKTPEDFVTQVKRILLAGGGLILVALAYVITAWLVGFLFGDSEIINSPVDYL